MGERKWALSLVEGVFPIKIRPIWRFFFNIMFNSGLGLLNFPGLGFAGRCDQGWCAVKPDVLSEILRMRDS